MRLGSKIIECVRNNDVGTAQKHQDIIVGLSRICAGKHLAYLKWIVGMCGIDVGAPRQPLPDLTSAEREAAMTKLKDIGLFDWLI